MKRLSVLSMVLALVSCAPKVTLEDAPCPCAAGWTCCAARNVCVAESTACPEVEDGRDGGPSGDAGPGDDAGGFDVPLVAPVPGGFRLGTTSSIAFDGRYSLVAFSHVPSADFCANCGAPRLRGVMLDAAGEPVGSPYGFPIADQSYGPVRTVAFDNRFLVVWLGASTLELAVVSGPNGTISGRASTPLVMSRYPQGGAFDVASDGHRAVVVWKSADQVLAAAVDPSSVPSALTPSLVLCDLPANGGLELCASPRVASDGVSFVAGWVTGSIGADAGGQRSASFHAGSLSVEGAALTIGWVREVGTPQGRFVAEPPVALGLNGNTVLAVYERDVPTRALVMQRFSGSNGQALEGSATVLDDSFSGSTNPTPRVVNAGGDFVVLVRLGDLRPHPLTIRVVPAAMGEASAPIELSASVTPWLAWDMPGGDLAWDGAQLTAVLDQEHAPIRFARFAPGATNVVSVDFGRAPAPQRSPSAARLQETTLVSYDGYERATDGGYVHSLLAVRAAPSGSPIDQQPVRLATPPEDFFGERSRVVAGADQYLVSWSGLGFTRGPLSIGVARVGPDGQVLSSADLDAIATDGGTEGPWDYTEVESAFDGERFAVSWTRQTGRTNDAGQTETQPRLATIDPTSGAPTLVRAGGGCPLAGVQGRFYDLCGGVLRQDGVTPQVTLYAPELYYPVGKALITPVALASNQDVLLAFSAVIEDLFAKTDAGYQTVRFEAVAVRAGAVVGRTLLPHEFDCPGNGGAAQCSASVAVDDNSFVVSQWDGSVARLARVTVSGADLVVSAVVEFPAAGWRSLVVVPQRDGTLLLVHDMADPVLDFTRIAARSIRL